MNKINFFCYLYLNLRLFISNLISNLLQKDKELWIKINFFCYLNLNLHLLFL